MKALKLSVFALFASTMYLTSCQKNHDKEMDTAPAVNSARAADQTLKIKEPEKLFERSIRISDATNTRTAQLRFRAVNKETLDKLALDDLEIRLVNTPTSLLQQPNPGKSSEKGAAMASRMGAQRTATGNDVKIPENAVLVDLPLESKNTPVSIEVRNKSTKSLTADPAAAALATTSLYYYNSSWHRVQVTNFHTNPVYASFYYHFWGWKFYSGYAYTLYRNGWGYYYNCVSSVGTNVTRYGAFWYRVTWWTYC
ncbi:hypothetical protein V9K67_01590 [Paraflavisolibacter sp. H34]|uniref:hypothetical protein n=1 Tax=Huijunlia imazamoxiresistens TaxID=3127457 RepID=UPI003016504C